MLILAFHSKLD